MLASVSLLLKIDHSYIANPYVVTYGLYLIPKILERHRSKYWLLIYHIQKPEESFQVNVLLEEESLALVYQIPLAFVQVERVLGKLRLVLCSRRTIRFQVLGIV